MGEIPIRVALQGNGQLIPLQFGDHERFAVLRFEDVEGPDPGAIWLTSDSESAALLAAGQLGMRVPRRVAAYDLVAVPGETVDTAGGKVVRLEILLPLVFTEQGNPQSLPGGAFQPADVGRLSDVRFL